MRSSVSLLQSEKLPEQPLISTKVISPSGNVMEFSWAKRGQPEAGGFGLLRKPFFVNIEQLSQDLSPATHAPRQERLSCSDFTSGELHAAHVGRFRFLNWTKLEIMKGKERAMKLSCSYGRASS